MKLLITDNEPNLRIAIKVLLQAFCPEIMVIEEADGVESGLKKNKNFSAGYCSAGCGNG